MIIGAGDLASFDTMVREILGASVDLLSWPTEVVESGLQLALADYEAAAPTVRVEFQVTSGGVKQNLSAIPYLRKVAAIAWPWVAAGQTIFEYPGLWRRFVTMYDGGVVRFLDVAPAGGDWLLVRYWRKFVIIGLNGAELPEPPPPPLPNTSGNVPVNDHALLVTGAAGYACGVRLRQLSEEAGVPERTVLELEKVRDGLLAGFAAGMNVLGRGGVEGGVNWGNIGL